MNFLGQPVNVLKTSNLNIISSSPLRDGILSQEPDLVSEIHL
jgi:hypothetical protein